MPRPTSSIESITFVPLTEVRKMVAFVRKGGFFGNVQSAFPFSSSTEALTEKEYYERLGLLFAVVNEEINLK